MNLDSTRGVHSEEKMGVSVCGGGGQKEKIRVVSVGVRGSGTSGGWENGWVASCCQVASQSVSQSCELPSGHVCG